MFTITYINGKYTGSEQHKDLHKAIQIASRLSWDHRCSAHVTDSEGNVLVSFDRKEERPATRPECDYDLPDTSCSVCGLYPLVPGPIECERCEYEDAMRGTSQDSVYRLCK
jgi:hypothetical protein